jgi:amidophosphoribosyltransferase
MFAELETGGVAIAHNGNLTNFLTLRERLVQDRRDLPVDIGYRSDPPPDRPLASRPRSSTASSTPSGQIEGGYAMVAITNKKMIGLRDPTGHPAAGAGRPGRQADPGSETCALDMIGALRARRRARRDGGHLRNPGWVRSRSMRASRSNPQPERPCVFEYVYFARPDSVVNGRSVYVRAQAHGPSNLAKETGC